MQQDYCFLTDIIATKQQIIVDYGVINMVNMTTW